MNAAEAAARLGVHETMVTGIAAHAAGDLVSLRDGSVMLVTDQVARVYVPEVDDAPEPKAEKKATKAAAKKAAGAA